MNETPPEDVTSAASPSALQSLLARHCLFALRLSWPTTMNTAQAITQAVASAVLSQDGAALAAALSAIDVGNAALLAQLPQRQALEQLCGTALEEPYDEMLLERFLSLAAVGKGDFSEACTHLERACSSFQSAFEKDTAWSMPGLHVLDLALRLAGKQADEHLKAKGEKMGKLQEAAGVLQKSFRIVVNDRAPIEQSKKWGGLHVINNLFKIYFRLNNLRLCQNLIRAVEGPGFPKALDGQVLSGRHFPMAQLVTYHYFVGRLSLLNSQFARAERQLTFAFDHCPTTSFKNKRLILRYLVPVRLVLGVFASPALLTKYQLPYFAQLCRAVHRGDLRTFERELDTHQQLFIRHGSYLLVERAKTIAYRNFFRRVHALHPAGTTKRDINMFRRCLNATGALPHPASYLPYRLLPAGAQHKRRSAFPCALAMAVPHFRLPSPHSSRFVSPRIRMAPSQVLPWMQMRSSACSPT